MAITTTIPSITGYTGTIPDKATQTKTDFANSVNPYLNYVDNTFVPSYESAKTALNTFATQANALATQANTDASTATTKAGEALTSANNASASAVSAAASAASAAAIAGAFVGTSTTSVLIAIGSKSFTTQLNEQYTAGIFMTAVSRANPSNYMFGQVTSYNAGTGALVIDVQVISGSGTYADWNLSLVGVRGAQGPAGATFDGGTITTELLATAGITVGGDIAFTQIDKGTVSTGTVTFTQSDGNVQRLQVGGGLTIATTGWHTTGSFSDLLIYLVNGGSAVVTMPTINWVKPDGTVTTTMSTYMTSISRTAFQTSGVDFIYLWTVNGGTTIYGKLV